jgi:hypothetical protein
MAANKPGEKTLPYFAVRLDLLRDIIREMESNEELKAIFKGKVSENLAFLGKDDDFGFSDVDPKSIGEEKHKRVTQLMNDILKKVIMDKVK